MLFRMPAFVMPVRSRSQATNPVMEAFLSGESTFFLPKPGTLVEGIIIDILGNKLLVDIHGVATGIISGKEARDSLGTLESLKFGDSISAYVIEPENDEGYFVLSLRKASQERTWQKFIKAYRENETLEVTIHEANKGGLLVLADGIKGFIPVSQLAPLHYPRVDGANTSEILSRLQKLISKKLQVKILTADQQGGKLILSEKAAAEDERRGTLRNLEIGNIVEGKISGIVKFGIFIAFEGLEGLVHISEIEWGHVKDPTSYGKIGDSIKAKVIGIDGDKISLSMKQLTPDPWKEVTENFKVGSVVEGRVDRITQFGVFLKLQNELSGLIHLSELSHESVKDPQQYVKLGQTLKAKVISIDIDDRRIGLSLKALEEPPITEKEEKAEKKEKTPKKTKKSAKA